MITGRGILLKDADKIFEPFVTTNKTDDSVVYGHGLGLTMVREILKKYQGTIDILSQRDTLGPGTTFLIKIPAGRVKMVG